jgi:alkylation response protein AidB-like acyl-CoA dehydrogenase
LYPAQQNRHRFAQPRTTSTRKRDPNSVSGVKIDVTGGSTASVVFNAAFFTTGGAPVPGRGVNAAMVPFSL